MTLILGTLYLLTVTSLSLYGFLGLVTLWQYWRHRHDAFPLPVVAEADLPPVTVQLPIYNERYVVERLIATAVHLNYPGHKLQIQVLDDSSDDTTRIAAQLVDHYKKAGVNICLLHREERQGYKAGALAAGLNHASGDYIAIFDADFAPRPDFLQKTIPHFPQNPRLGMIQTRWDHLNADDSPLTAAQAIALDKHFALEQAARHRADLFPKFNGAGGVWRRACLEDAGGWQADTVCEDLCLSTRAVLRGWQFRFLNDVTAPAELPVTISAFKNQQARWAKGAIQCLLKFGPAILTDKKQRLTARLYGFFAMQAHMTPVFFIILLLLQLPLITLDYQYPRYTLFFAIAGASHPLLFILAQQVLHPDWRRRLRHFPTLLLVAIGLAPSNARAVLQVFYGRHHPFIRTPKQGGLQRPSTPYRFPFDWIVLAELFLALYAAVGIALLLWQGESGPLFFLLTCMLGFGYVAGLSLRELLRDG